MAVDLRDLLARVKAAKGSDTDLDADLWDALHSWPWDGPYWSWRAAAMAFGWNTNLTGSLDAALALARRAVGPGLLSLEGGWEPYEPQAWPAWTVRWYPIGVKVDGKSWHAAIDCAPTPALALLAALIDVKARTDAALRPAPQGEAG